MDIFSEGILNLYNNLKIWTKSLPSTFWPKVKNWGTLIWSIFLRIGSQWKTFWDTLLAFTLNLENYVKTSDQIKCDFAKALASLWGSDTRSIKILTYYKMLQSCSTLCTFFSWQFFSGIDQYWKICRLRTSLQRTTGNSIDGSLQSDSQADPRLFCSRT